VCVYLLLPTKWVGILSAKLSPLPMLWLNWLKRLSYFFITKIRDSWITLTIKFGGADYMKYMSKWGLTLSHPLAHQVCHSYFQLFWSYGAFGAPWFFQGYWNLAKFIIVVDSSSCNYVAQWHLNGPSESHSGIKFDWKGLRNRLWWLKWRHVCSSERLFFLMELTI
jgi:hypothetical protein